MTVANAEALGIPAIFNVATYFVDRNVALGRGSRVAVECGDQRITYAEVLTSVNRVGSALRRLGIHPEERVLLLLPDGPEFIYSFFGAIKMGAVPIPTSTLFKPTDYEYILNDSRARVIVISEALLPQLQAPRRDRRGRRKFAPSWPRPGIRGSLQSPHSPRPKPSSVASPRPSG